MPLGWISFSYNLISSCDSLGLGGNGNPLLFNSSSSKQKVIFDIHYNGTVESKEKIIPSKGFYEFKKLKNKVISNSRLIIKSKLYLARPIVFKYMDSSFDVFHG